VNRPKRSYEDTRSFDFDERARGDRPDVSNERGVLSSLNYGFAYGLRHTLGKTGHSPGGRSDVKFRSPPNEVNVA